MEPNSTAIYAMAGAIIWVIVRVLKSDTAIPITIPPKWRAIVAMLLGVLAGILDTIARGTPWQTAITAGLLAGAGAIAAHETVVEGVRNGKDVLQDYDPTSGPPPVCPHCGMTDDRRQP